MQETSTYLFLYKKGIWFSVKDCNIYLEFMALVLTWVTLGIRVSLTLAVSPNSQGVLLIKVVPSYFIRSLCQVESYEEETHLQYHRVIKDQFILDHLSLSSTSFIFLPVPHGTENKSLHVPSNLPTQTNPCIISINRIYNILKLFLYYS